jgi:hypothetical protein
MSDIGPPSDVRPPPAPPPDDPYLPPPPPPRRDGCLTAFMVIIGIILLLPGLCAVIVGISTSNSSGLGGLFTQLVLISLLIGAGGIALIVAAIRGRRS